MASAHILINGLQLMNCTIPTESEGSCVTYADAGDDLTVMRDHGRWEISTMLYADMAWMPETKHATLIGELVVDGDQVLHLGALPGPDQPSNVVTRFLSKPPSSLAFRVCHDLAKAAVHPDEDALVEEVLLVMNDETVFPKGGSTAHHNVHNRVKDLEIYNRVVVKHYASRWTAFVANHPDDVTLIKLKDDKNSLTLGLGSRRNDEAEPRHEELHIVHANDVDSAEERNEAQKAVRAKNEAIVVDKMIQTLGEEATMMEYTELLRRLAVYPEFVTCLMPSLSMVQRFVSMHKDVFWVRKDPEHTTRVGLVSTLGIPK